MPAQAAPLLRQISREVHLDSLSAAAWLVAAARHLQGRYAVGPVPDSCGYPAPPADTRVHPLPRRPGTCNPPQGDTSVTLCTSGLIQMQRQSTAWALDGTGPRVRERHVRTAQRSGRCLTPVSSWSRRVQAEHFRHLNSREEATGWGGDAAITIPCTATILPIREGAGGQSRIGTVFGMEVGRRVIGRR